MHEYQTMGEGLMLVAFDVQKWKKIIKEGMNEDF